MLGQAIELAVFGPEVMPPLRQAMRLVDRDQGQGHGFEPFQRLRAEQRFRRDIEKIELPRRDRPPDRAAFLEGEIGIQRRRPHARIAQRGDLIRHQRDERRDHKPQPRPAECRNLITQRLPPARRHQHEGVLARDHMIDDLRLLSAKGVVAVNGLQNVQGIGGHGGWANRTKFMRPS